jgi:hypothetical protein
MRAAQSALVGQGGRTAEFDRGGVLLALEKLPPIDGTSGLVKLHGAPNGHHALNRPILLVTVTKDGTQALVRNCGKLYERQQTTC